jgi:hypothetical protein
MLNDDIKNKIQLKEWVESWVNLPNLDHETRIMLKDEIKKKTPESTEQIYDSGHETNITSYNIIFNQLNVEG